MKILKEILKALKELISIILGFALVAFICWGIYLIANKVISVFIKLDPTVAASLIAASVTIIVSVISVLLAKLLEHRSEIRKEMRIKKIPAYTDLINFMFRVSFAKKRGQNPPTEKEILDFFQGFTEKIVVWGSDDVINAFNAFRTFAQKTQTAQSENILFVAETLFLTIRKDLGHKNKGLTKGKLLGLFVNDIEKYL